jgi:hypothetical protein
MLERTRMARPSAYRFEIRVKGSLADPLAERFDGVTIHANEHGDTVLDGVAADQSALFGVLHAIETFGLTVVSVITCRETS